jgi:3-oxoacyl-[acyl-carrier protein] reductase
MEQRVAVITGAGAGIGAAIAGRLADDGHHVVLTDQNFESADAAASKIVARGLSAQALHMDVSALVSIEGAFDVVARQHGRCDILVNNAGVATTHSFIDFPDDAWQATLDINVTGAFRCSQRAARMMVPRGWGRVVNISSISGIRAGIGRTAYGTSKAALHGLTRQMCIELAPYGITANAIAPGPIETALAQDLHTQATRRELCRLVPAGHYGSTEVIAGAVAFLASDEASYINGQTIPVDGGLTAAGVLQI